MHLRIKFKKKPLLFIITIISCITLATGYNIFAAKRSTLIPRKVLFDNPEYTNVSISPNGKWLSYSSPKDGVLNIWIKNLESGAIKLLTNEKKRGVAGSWLYDNEHIIYTRDENGDENTRLYKVNINSGTISILTPKNGVKAYIIGSSYLKPNKILIGLNDRDPIHHDVYELEISTGKKKLLFKNEEFTGFWYNEDYELVFAYKQNDQGGTEYYRPAKNNKFILYRTVSLEDSSNTGPQGLDISKEWMYWLDSTGSDINKLIKINLKTNERKILYDKNKVDIISCGLHPFTKEITGVTENYLQQNIIPLAEDIKQDYEILRSVDKGQISVIDSTLKLDKWIVAFWDDIHPLRYYLFDRITKKATFLFYDRPKLKDLPLVQMTPFEIKSRDGLPLVSYLSLPKNKKPNKSVPMVLVVHGGPINCRDEWGLDVTHQWLANRGYAVLSVNYRGSGEGFGKSFVTAAYGEYAGKMHDDLIDAVNWAIKEKIADPQKIAIYGGSYGGYAALVGATMTPDTFACAISYVGMSNLITFMETIPPYWKTSYAILEKMLGGNYTTEKGKAALRSKSPLTYVDNIKKPLLILHGVNDPRVKKSESDQIIAAMKKKSIPATYAIFPDEGHGWARKENQLADKAVVEAFLSKHLGGKLETLNDEIKNSSIQVLEGNIF